VDSAEVSRLLERIRQARGDPILEAELGSREWGPAGLHRAEAVGLLRSITADLSTVLGLLADEDLPPRQWLALGFLAVPPTSTDDLDPVATEFVEVTVSVELERILSVTELEPLAQLNPVRAMTVLCPSSLARAVRGLPVDPLYHRRLVLVRAMNRPDDLPVIISAW
jgi:hypothetical protein